ncbi:MAG: NAD(P)-binding domain-containing protein [Lacisediminihabitans sp.]
MNTTIGILGAGRVGMVLARLAVAAGYRVLVAGSGDASRIAPTLDALSHGAVALAAAEVARNADTVILALPLVNYRDVPAGELRGKLVIDAMNYWWAADGIREDLADPRTSSSETVQAFLHESRVVKALNHMGYLELEEEARVTGHPDRKALAIAGDAAADITSVARLVDSLGFDAVVAGPLADGVRFEPNTEPFGADVNAAELRAMLERFPNSARGQVVARARAGAGPETLRGSRTGL